MYFDLIGYSWYDSHIKTGEQRDVQGSGCLFCDDDVLRHGDEPWLSGIGEKPDFVIRHVVSQKEPPQWRLFSFTNPLIVARRYHNERAFLRDHPDLLCE